MASSKSLMNVLTFSFGSAIGFFLCYLLLSMILEEKVEIQPHILHNDPHGQHSADTDNDQLQGQMNFNADSGQHKGILLHLTNYIGCSLFMYCKMLFSSVPKFCMSHFLSLANVQIILISQGLLNGGCLQLHHSSDFSLSPWSLFVQVLCSDLAVSLGSLEFLCRNFSDEPLTSNVIC